MDLAIDQTRPGPGGALNLRLLELGLAAVTSPSVDSERLAHRRQGRIVTQDGRLVAIYGRWLPYTSHLLRVWWDTRWRPLPQDRCELYFHTPWTCPGFLTLSYVRSGPYTSLSTFYAATLVLDEIARLRDANAIVCNVTNLRISDRLMLRWGWEKHCQHWAGRHFIKRFYGRFPEISSTWRERLGLATEKFTKLRAEYEDRSPSGEASRLTE